MAKGDPIDPAEEVVRAGRYPYWDSDTGRATPSAFHQEEVSVSRLAILNLEEIVSIFKKDFDERLSPDCEPMKIRGLGRATVDAIIRQAENPIGDGKKRDLPPFVLIVVEDKVENEPGSTDNPAHALIRGRNRENPSAPQKISKGVAKRLLDIFNWVPLPD